MEVSVRCPNCNNPMSMGRYEPGKYKVFNCNRCQFSKKKTESYSGQIIINSRVPVVHQERE